MMQCFKQKQLDIHKIIASALAKDTAVIALTARYAAKIVR